MSESPTPLPDRRGALTARERWLVASMAVAPVALALIVLAPVAAFGPATGGDVVAAAAVYGGLIGLAAGFVTVDRLHHRQCPRCHTRNGRGATGCEECAYDLVRRPRYACSERHRIFLDPGLCDCGRRVNELDIARGVGPEVRWILRAGLWFLAFLMIAGLLLQLTTR